MPGHYRRAHPDVVLPEAVARFGLQRSPRPRLPGRKTQRALPQPVQRAQPRLLLAGRTSGGVSDGDYVAASARRAAQIAADGGYVGPEAAGVVPIAAPVPAAAQPQAETALSFVEKNWPTIFIAAFAVALLGAMAFQRPDAASDGSGNENSRLVSFYQPKGDGQ